MAIGEKSALLGKSTIADHEHHDLAGGNITHQRSILTRSMRRGLRTER